MTAARRLFYAGPQLPDKAARALTANIMIVSDRKAPEGVPLVIHNIGSGTKEENRLFDFTLTGHYRIAKGQR
ncbi:MAG: DUF1287 domain-containing protein [Candidatus Brocadiia bacterium]